MSKKLGLFAILLALVIAAPKIAFAQVQTGSILVKAVDQQGAVIPGATVSISSPVLPAPLTGVTDGTGTYQFASLNIGTYVVRVTLQGFKTSVRDNLQLSQGQTVSVEAQLSVGGMTEETTVKGEPPVVDTKSATVKVNLDKDLLEKTPGGKDIWSILQYKAPGVVFDTPDVGGNQAGLQRAFTARGTPNAQNTQMLNGVNVNDPSAQGFSMNYYDPNSFENIQISSGAQDIAVGTAGVFINMITKSGTNKYNGQALFTCQGHCKFAKTQTTNVDSALLKAGLRADSNAVDYITNTNAQLGGPLVKNRLFFFASYNYQPTHVNQPGFPAVSPVLPVQLGNTSEQDTTDIMTGTGKFNYQMNNRNRFEVFVEKQRYDKPNRLLNANGYTQDSASKELDYGNTIQGAWNLLVTNKFFVDTKVSYNNIHFPLLQKTNLQTITDSVSGIRYRNAQTQQEMLRERLQIVSNGQYYLSNLFGGRHEIKGGVDYGRTPADVLNSRVDDVQLVYSGTTGRGSTVTLSNTPLHTVSAVSTTALYAQDSYSRGRLTLIGGVRWERVEGYLPAQETPASRYFPLGTVINNVTIGGVVQNYTVRKQFEAVHGNPLWKNWAPRANLTFDITGDGKTVLKASVGRYLDQVNTGTPPNPNVSITQAYTWNDTNNDLVFQAGTPVWDGTKYVGGELGAPSGNANIPATAIFDTTLKRAKRNEFTIGVDRELVPTLLGSLTYIYRKEKDPQGTVDQSIDTWGSIYTQRTLTDPGRDGVVGSSDDAPIVVYDLNANASTSTKTVNDDRLAQRYNGIELTLTRRFQGKWSALGSYSYSHTRQDVVSYSNPNNAFVNAAGESGGRRHNLKFSGVYTLPYQFLLSGNLTWQSGLPITRTWAIPACSATVISNCLRNATSVNAEERGTVTLPKLTVVDLRVGRFFTIGTHKLDASIDLYNLFNANTTYAVRTTTGVTAVREGGIATNPAVNIASFLSPTANLGPRIIRLNLTYSFSQK